MRVRVHYNLHRKDFSVVDPATRRVIANVSDITLLGVTFHVSEKSRQQVVRSKRRSVHAYALGTLAGGDYSNGDMVPVTYNPYRCGHFHVVGHTNKPIQRADVAVFRHRYCWIPNTVTVCRGN